MKEGKVGFLPKTESRHEWLVQRTKGIGSSDASTILGLNQYESPYSLWALKTGRIPLDVKRDQMSEEIMEWGNLLEPVILQETMNRLGIEIHKPDQAMFDVEFPFLQANLDGWSEDDRICEFKTTNERNKRLWLGQIPDHAEIQVHHSALVTGAREAIVAGLIGGQQLVIHEIRINENILEILFDAEREFWGYVERDEEPPLDGHVRTLEVLNSAWTPKDGAKEVERVEVEYAWQLYHEAHEAEKEAKRIKAEAKAQLLALMEGNRELVTGRRRWAAIQATAVNESKLLEAYPKETEPFVRNVKKLDREAFRAEYPELFAEFQGKTLSVKGADVNEGVE